MAWLEQERLQDSGGPEAAGEFAHIARWGEDPDEARHEADRLAKELGLHDGVKIDFVDEEPDRGGAAVAGGWDPYKRVLLLPKAKWQRDAGWKRIDTIAHEVRHAAQTGSDKEWESAWKAMTDLATAIGRATPGSSEAFLAIWRYRDDPLEAQAIAFGRQHRDSFRRSKA